MRLSDLAYAFKVQISGDLAAISLTSHGKYPQTGSRYRPPPVAIMRSCPTFCVQLAFTTTSTSRGYLCGARTFRVDPIRTKPRKCLKPRPSFLNDAGG
jgi:hypothetical protein